MKITAEDRTTTLQGTEFYIIDKDKAKARQDAVDLHAEVIIPKKHNFIGRVVDRLMSYWAQNNGNWRIEPLYSKGIRLFWGKYALETGMVT